MEFSLSIVAFAGVALLGVLPGIGIAVGLSILNVFRRAWRPYQTTLGLVDGPGRATTTSARTRTPTCCPAWSSTASTRRCSSPTRRRSGTRSCTSPAPTPPPPWIVVAAEPITDVDTTAADFLLELDRVLDERGQTSCSPELKDPVRRKIERYGLTRAIEPQPVLPDRRDAAVDAFRAQHRRRVGRARVHRRRTRRLGADAAAVQPRRSPSSPSDAPAAPCRRRGHRAESRARHGGRRPRANPTTAPIQPSARRPDAGPLAGEPHPERTGPDRAAHRGGQVHRLPVDADRDRSASSALTTTSRACGPEQPPLVGAAQQADRLARAGPPGRRSRPASRGRAGPGAPSRRGRSPRRGCC